MQTITLTFDPKSRILTADSEGAGTVIDDTAVTFKLNAVKDVPEGSTFELVCGTVLGNAGRRYHPVLRFSDDLTVGLHHQILQTCTGGTLPISLRITMPNRVVLGSRQLILGVAVVPDAYKDLTGRAYLEFMASFFATGSEKDAMVQKGIELADLGDRIDSKVDTYSKGMMRRLLIARAIMPSPKLAIMDEVTSGLDVINAYEIRDIIRGIARDGVTVVMSSHNMFEVDMLCDRVGMIDQGNLILLGTPSELKSEFGVDTLEEVFVKAVKG